ERSFGAAAPRLIYPERREHGERKRRGEGNESQVEASLRTRVEADLRGRKSARQDHRDVEESRQQTSNQSHCSPLRTRTRWIQPIQPQRPYLSSNLTISS